MNKKMNKKQLWLICLLHIICIHVFAQIDPGKEYDLQKHINKELSKGKKKSLFLPEDIELLQKETSIYY